MTARQTLSILVLIGFALATGTATGTTISNGIYEVHIADSPGFSVGSWNAVTGASHPTGAGNDLTYDAFTTATNFSSLRVFGSADYTWGGRGTSVNLDPFFTSAGVSPFGTAANSFRQNWDVTPESLHITQDLIIPGTTVANSGVYHTIQITNTGGGSKTVGWRNLYDWAVNDPGFDDGPNNQIELFDGTVIIPATTTEFNYAPGTALALARVSVDPGVPTYQPFLSLGFDPSFIAALPVTTACRYAYVSWPGSVGTAFDYTIGPSGVTGDSAGLTYFNGCGTGHVLGPGESVRFTQVIFGVVPEGAPPGVEQPGVPGVPAPASLLLLAGGLIAAFAYQRRR